ncbi:MAG: hypothetical protein JWP26_2932 [Devosia sp.]|uniref:hypothetical protein n=1 Tax=Devosia sp. TaxID=1871048 RepID=UPI0026219651|nr:hypothetical protein [Devosia sp.]MDB5538107.1 hypothetical protein [Devosia sp.]MDB5587962.1 hypothetical protein [Devosia sp.]
MSQTEPHLLFKQAVSPFWSSFLMGLFLGAGAIWIQMSKGEPLLAALSVGVPLAAGVGAIAWLMGWVNTRGSVATLYRDGLMLTGRRQTPIGPGTPFSVPIPAPANWHFKLITRSKARKSITLDFTHGDETFRLPCYAARVVDLDALRALAPSVISGAVVAGERSLMSKGVR